MTTSILDIACWFLNQEAMTYKKLQILYESRAGKLDISNAE